MSAVNEDVEIIKDFSSGRKVPTLIGKLPQSNVRIPGGPYTPTQLLLAGIVGSLLWVCRPLWTVSLLMDVVVIALGVFASLILSRKLTFDNRNPFSYAGAFFVTVSRTGVQPYGPTKSASVPKPFFISHRFVFSTVKQESASQIGVLPEKNVVLMKQESASVVKDFVLPAPTEQVQLTNLQRFIALHGGKK